MIKKIIEKIKSWFIPKREIDPHEELYLKTPEPEVPVYKDEKTAIKGFCNDHPKYKHRCPKCREAVA